MNNNHRQFTTNMTMSFFIKKELLSNNKRIGKVHSVFKNGFNILLDKQLIFISPENQPLSAHGIQWSQRTFQYVKDKLKPGLRVQLLNDYWRFYTHPLIIDVFPDKETFLDLSLNFTPFEFEVYDRFRTALTQAHLEKHCDPFLFQIDSSILAIDEKNTLLNNRKWLQQWIGAGHGLTPSGDDLVQGMMIIALLMDHTTFINSVKDVTNIKRTTDIAHAYYQNLFHRHVNQNWLLLLEAILAEDNLKIQTNIQNIQSYGASSGNDMLYGSYYYLSQILN